MRKKGLAGVDEFSNERVARAIDRAEALVRETAEAAKRFGDRRLEGRVDRICDQAREVFRAVEQDPSDLNRARTFLSVYLLGLRDATVKFADLWSRSRDSEARGAVRGAARRSRDQLRHASGRATRRQPQRPRHRDRGAAGAAATGRAASPATPTGRDSDG